MSSYQFLHRRSSRDVLRDNIEEAVGEHCFDQFVRAAEVDLNVFKAACDRVYIDGFYGPVSTADWREQDGREPASIVDARKIVEAVIAEVRDVPTTDLLFCQQEGGLNECDEPRSCQGHEVATGMVERKDFLKAYLPWYAEIYGGW